MRNRHVPVIMQMEAAECGAACLTMILAYYGKWLPLAQVRSDCGVSRDGSNAGNIIRAARACGLMAKGYRLEPEQLRKKGCFPCIVHWNFNHFMVLTGFRRNLVCLNDPARGSITMSAEEFDRGFTGVCLCFAPGEDFRPAGERTGWYKNLNASLTDQRSAGLFMLALAVLIAALSLYRLPFLQVFLDEVLTGGDQTWFRGLVIGLCGLACLQLAAIWILSLWGPRICGRFAVMSDTSRLWKLLHLSPEFFSQRTPSELMHRLDAGSAMAELMNSLFFPLMVQSVTALISLTVMLRYSPLMTLIAMLSAVLNVFVILRTSAAQARLTAVRARNEAVLYTSSVSGLSMIESVKANGAEDRFLAEWAGCQAAVAEERNKELELATDTDCRVSVFSVCLQNVMLFLGILQMTRGRMSLGALICFQSLACLFCTPFRSLGSVNRNMRRLQLLSEQTEDIMNAPSDPAYTAEGQEGGEEYRKLNGEIEFRNVTFGYARLAEPQVSEISFHIPVGRQVALVGKAGCGKSTLAGLLVGDYVPQNGEILLDGRHLTEINRDVFTASVAAVGQDISLFADTVANNIKMWDDTVEDFEMILAARDAMVHEEILHLPGGYQYRLTEQGRNLSGGQRQRLEIARVLAQDPRILVLDEATAALDAVTEARVMQAIRARGITTLVIAHRLSAIRDCDEILVMEEGRIVARGTHAQLKETCESYRQLIADE